VLGGVAWWGINIWGTVVRCPVTEKDYFSPKHSMSHYFSYLMEYKGFSREDKLEGKRSYQTNLCCAETNNN
jgi:hypothetical protein